MELPVIYSSLMRRFGVLLLLNPHMLFVAKASMWWWQGRAACFQRYGGSCLSGGAAGPALRTPSPGGAVKDGQTHCGPGASPLSCAGGLCKGEVYAGLWLQQEFSKHMLAGRPRGKRL